MKSYDPKMPPDPAEWLKLDEQKRLSLVTKCHRRAGNPAPHPEMHALIHVVVENQVAAGDPPATAAAIARLMNEGLDRHDAVHAVGTVLAEDLFSILQPGGAATDWGDYAKRLKSLSAADWFEQFED